MTGAITGRCAAVDVACIMAHSPALMWNLWDWVVLRGQHHCSLYSNVAVSRSVDLWTGSN